MKTIILAAAALTLAACSCTTAPAKPAPDSAKVSKVTFCRSGFTITAGDKPDSVYTGCTE